MTRRPAVTLIEVLMAMFIMAIGMMALLTLFPLGALSMAQALRDDRCASTASMAENVAIAMNVRNDSVAVASAAVSPLIYVDPNGVIGGCGKVGGVIPRATTSFVGGSQALADRWFSLPDDITFLENGTPDTINTGGVVDRGRRYSYAYLLRRLSSTLTQLYVVVYSGRPVGSLVTETTVGAAVLNTNSLTLTGAAALPIKRGSWILDPVNGYFYRVTNLSDAGANLVVDVQPNLVAAPASVVIMENVAEVFDKGTGWQP